MYTTLGSANALMLGQRAYILPAPLLALSPDSSMRRGFPIPHRPLLPRWCDSYDSEQPVDGLDVRTVHSPGASHCIDKLTAQT